MEYNLKKLKSELELKRNELNTAIEKEKSEQIIYQKSVEVDNAITKLTKAQAHYEECKQKIKKYANILQRPDKEEILNMIKIDVINNFANMPENEVIQFAQNLYILCVFEANKISKDEMTTVMMCNNHIFLYENQVEDSGFTNETKINLEFYSEMEKKYINIIKEKM